MSFTKKSRNTDPLIDTVFAIANIAKQDTDPNKINATVGTLYGEDGKIIAFDSVFKPYDQISSAIKAAYAQNFKGNPDFCQAITKWLIQDKKVVLKHDFIATPGGTGAISLVFNNFLEKGDPVLIPDIAWPVYHLMAQENELKTVFYNLFKGQKFDIDGLKKLILDNLQQKDKLILLINDPCQNPTGYSLSNNEWQEIVTFLNSLPENKKIILLNDVAYIDYSLQKDSRLFLDSWNELHKNILALIAFSCSKSFTSYGLRVGGLFFLHQNEDIIHSISNVLDRQARATWSNVANAAMKNIAHIIQNPVAYLNEKKKAVTLLQERANLFKKEADLCQLAYYPYKEGFFLTLIHDQPIKYQKALMEHHIYTVRVPKGIRIALCSLSLKQISGLAKRLKEIQTNL